MAFVALFKKYEVSFTEISSYSSVVNEAKVVELVEKATGAQYANGECLRLENFVASGSGARIELTRANFFDFVSSNLALLNYDRMKSTSTDEEMAAVAPLLKIHEGGGKPNSVEDIIHRNYLSGVLAISLMLVDKKGLCLLVKRNGNVGIGSNYISVSVTGSVEPVDLKAQDPLIACCCRECMEELGIPLTPACVSSIGIVCGEKKLQPIALFEAVVPDFDTLPAAIARATDYSFENDGYVLCQRSKLIKILEDPNVLITEAGEVHFRETIC